MNNENYMRIEEICEHECESSTVITSYSNTLRTCGTNEANFVVSVNIIQPTTKSYFNLRNVIKSTCHFVVFVVICSMMFKSHT